MSRRMRWAGLAAAASIALIAGGFVMLRGGSTPVPLVTAVERFRERTVSLSQPRAAEPAPSGAAEHRTGPAVADKADVTARAETADGLRPIPVEGVYIYATTGGDEVDVLGGRRHAYPAETTITVRHAGCGIVERWDALEERWDERESCRTANGEELKRMTSFHEFFGHADQRTLHCTGYTYPKGFQPDASWTSRCASENTTAVTTLDAIGWEDVDVDGVAVRAMHVHAETTVTGEQEGTSVRDVWGATETGIVVRERTTLTSHSNQPVFGRTRYHESYEIRLKSLRPRR